MRYNGHKNWNHWNVALWIGNDEGLYRLALDCIGQARGRGAAGIATRMMLDSLPATTPDGAYYTFSSVRAALVGLES